MSHEKLVKVKAPHGKVHYAYLNDNPADSLYDPYCNHRSWIGDYWGKKWTETNEPVTCGNCLSAIKNNGPALPLAAALSNLGEEMRQTKTAQLKKFLELSRECPHRTVVISDIFTEGEKDEYLFACEKHKSSFEWLCSPINCSCLGKTIQNTWYSKTMERPNEKEIKDYEDSRRAKKDKASRS